jgi:hypothetical protein
VLSILVRPVREQLEHDRVIRLLLAKWKKSLSVEANLGDERRAPVKIGQMTVFPDLVLNSQLGPKRVQALIEVETGESVNHLEAMAQWTHMSRTRAPFFLYVPVGTVEQARRLCDDHQVALGELWSYYVLGEQVRFTLVQRDEALAAAQGRSDGMADVIETEILGPLETAAPAAGPPADQPAASAPAAAKPARAGGSKAAPKPAAKTASTKKTAPKGATRKAAPAPAARSAKGPAKPAGASRKAKAPARKAKTQKSGGRATTARKAAARPAARSRKAAGSARTARKAVKRAKTARRR